MTYQLVFIYVCNQQVCKYVSGGGSKQSTNGELSFKLLNVSVNFASSLFFTIDNYLFNLQIMKDRSLI